MNELELEKLQDKYDTLKATIITTGFWKLTNSNRERIRKLNHLEEQIKNITKSKNIKWKYQI